MLVALVGAQWGDEGKGKVVDALGRRLDLIVHYAGGHDPGQTIAVDFTVTNLGNASTSTPRWTDRVWLSLDPVVSSDDILVATLGNESALGQGESYRSITGSVVSPECARNDARMRASNSAVPKGFCT